MKKVVMFLIVFLVLPFTIKAGVLCTAEDTFKISSSAVSAVNLGYSVDTISYFNWGPVDSAYVWKESVSHDTAKEYIKSIEEVCDTSWTKAWNPVGMIRGEQYFEQVHIIDTIKCRIDTTWVNKIPVLDGYFYVLPEEYEVFKEWVKDWFVENFVEED